MKTVITALSIVFAGLVACDTPEPTTTYPSDSTGINSNRPIDSTMQQQDTTMRQDTTMHYDSIPQPSLVAKIS